jgi:hypothetical protein
LNEADDDFNLEDYLRFKAQLEAEEAKKRELEGAQEPSSQSQQDDNYWASGDEEDDESEDEEVK